MRRSFVQFYSNQHRTTYLLDATYARLHEEPVPAEILDAVPRQDDLRKRDPTSPELLRRNKDIQKRTCVYKREFVLLRPWTKTDLTKMWRTIKGIDGRAKRTVEIEAISFNEISFSSSKPLSAKFNKQFTTSKLGRHTSSSETRLVTRETKKTMEMAHRFIVDLVMRAIKSCRNSKAFGQDILSISHLKNLGPRAIEYITALFNLSVTTLSDSGYVEVIINHPDTEDWQRHIPRIFISGHLASLPSRESSGNSDPTLPSTNIPFLLQSNSFRLE